MSKIGNPYDQYLIYAEGQRGNIVNTVEGEANARLIAGAPVLLHDLLSVTVLAIRANNLQHAGLTIDADTWAELYESCNHARATLFDVVGNDTLPELTQRPAPKCFWQRAGVEHDSDTFDTGCGHSFNLFDGVPSDNDMKYCCFCGRTITETIEGDV